MSNNKSQLKIGILLNYLNIKLITENTLCRFQNLAEKLAEEI